MGVTDQKVVTHKAYVMINDKTLFLIGRQIVDGDDKNWYLSTTPELYKSTDFESEDVAYAAVKAFMIFHGENSEGKPSAGGVLQVTFTPLPWKDA